MSAALGVRVLSNYRSDGINTHGDGCDSTWIVNDDWCGAITELKESVAPAVRVVIGSHEMSCRIDVLN